MFELAGKYNLGSLLIIRKLKEEGYRPFGKADWNQDFVQNTLKNRALMGEYQPHTGDAQNRVPVGEVKKGYYPTKFKGEPIISQSAFDLAQTAIAAKNSNPGKKGGARGGGRRNPNNLFGVLLHDVTIPTPSGQNNTMYYRVEKSNSRKKNGAEKSRRPAHYITTYSASRL